jgi:methionine-rich copper-binding protein CopC
MKRIFLFTVTMMLCNFLSAQTTLVNYNSTWKYLANGTNQGTAWRATAFNDAAWPSGTAAFGYGASGITTTVSFGSNSKKKYITTYFRKAITVTDASVYSSFTLNLKRDDGAVVYINGTEIYRSNMPTGTIAYNTKASSEATDNGTAIQSTTLSAATLVTGANVIAVEIHQFANNGPDLFFDLQLNAASDVTPPTVSNYSPADNSSDISASANLVLTFSENVQKGTGNIFIKENGVTTQTISVASTSVVVTGNSVSINPADFSFGAAVNIEIEAGAFKDLFNNNYAGIANATTWNFSIVSPDVTPPTVNSYSPADNSTNVSRSTNLVLTLNENIQKGIGNIIIKEAGLITQTIDVTSALVTVSGNTATINPADFSFDAAVNIEIEAGAFKDLSNNNYAGIVDASTWNFSVQAAPPVGPQTLVAYGSAWKYLDNGTNQGTAWRGTSFNDAAWASGNAQLGYGDGDEATVVGYGGNASNKYVTTYFRKTISIADASILTSISGNVKRDDGVAIYVNGTEVYRNNLAAGAGYTTLATLASDDGATAQAFNFSPAAFVTGNNVIAVEIHQNSVTSSDISFDLELIGNTGSGALLTRGPYMNMGNQTAVTLRWRTDVATNSRAEVGTVHGTYPLIFNDASSVTEHEIRITGLNPDTKYFYRFGSSTQVLQAGTDNYFVTAPPANTTRKQRFAVFGDCGRNDNGYQPQTLTAYQNYLGNNAGEIMILLGDNAYTNGTDAEYQTGFFAPYQSSILKNHIIMPSPGNHDYYSTNQASRTGPYYQNFTMPTAGECGGVASGTEAFYSWDRGDVHFISMDSYGTESPNTTRLYDTTGPQVTWLKQDLAANTKKWTIVYWHHPPYTMGSHNSDTESELVNIRTNLLRILERNGVDLVMCGHSHDYERSYLLKDYFGNEASFNVNTHAVTSSSAMYNGTSNSCPYNLANGQVNHGTVYVVSGSSGASGSIQAGYPHNAMPWSFNDGGMLQLEIEGNRLDAKFIRRNQVIADQFTIMKDVSKNTNLNIIAGTPTQLTASWIGTYSWSTGETTRTITVSPNANTTYSVNDGAGCLGDVFNITVSGGQRAIPVTKSKATGSLSITPSPVHRGQQLFIQSGDAEPKKAAVLDAFGRLIQTYQLNQSLYISTEKLIPGIYYIRITGKSKTVTEKIVVTE